MGFWKISRTIKHWNYADFNCFTHRVPPNDLDNNPTLLCDYWLMPHGWGNKTIFEYVGKMKLVFKWSQPFLNMLRFKTWIFFKWIIMRLFPQIQLKLHQKMLCRAKKITYNCHVQWYFKGKSSVALKITTETPPYHTGKSRKPNTFISFVSEVNTTHHQRIGICW